MSATKSVRTTRDTYANQDRGSATPATEATLLLRGTGTAHTKQAFLAFGQMPVGVQIISATLHFVIKDAKSGARNLTASRISTSWSAKQLSWDNRPTVVGTNQASVALGTVTAFTEVTIPVTAMVQDAANGSAFYGFRLSSDSDTGAETICSAEAGREERRPWLEITYSTSPAAPTDLSPVDGQYVGVNKPVLSWSFGDPARPGATQTALQVQVANDALFTASVFDSGKVTQAEQQLDLATTAYGGATADSTRYWRVRVYNDDDVVSEYSDAASFMFHALGTVSISNPPVGGVVNDATPPIGWTVASMTQQAYRVLVERLSAAGVWVSHADSERQVSAVTSWTVPDAYVLQEGTTYRVTVQVWDTLAREPGAASYATAQRSPMTYTRTAGTTAPAGLAASGVGALVTLTWTRASAPDYWSIIVNGVNVMPRIPGTQLFVSGTNYALSYWRAEPRISSTYEVQAVVNSAGVLKASTGNPTVVFATNPIGITLVDELTNTAAWLAGQESWGADIAESSTVYIASGGRSPTLATNTVRGYEGTVTGQLVGSPNISGVTNPGVDAQTARDAFLSLRERGRSLRLIIGDRNIPVKVYEVSAVPEPTPGDRLFRAGFSFFQTGEFDIAWELDVLALAKLGINAAAYDRALRANERSWRIIVRLHKLNGNVLDTLTGTAQQSSRVMSGSVNIDASAEVTRTAEMTLLDPDRELMFEDTVQQGALWANRMLSIEYGVLVGAAWADVPVFYGRLSSYARDGDEVTIAATGKEADHIEPAFFGTKLHIPKNTLISVAIKRILSAHGETRFSFADAGKRRTETPIDMVPTDSAWKFAKRLANDADRHLYFDATGIAKLRTFGGDDPVWTFDGTTVTDRPGVTFELSELRNEVRVRGKVPDKGDDKKVPPSAIARPKANDPLHPNNLGLRLIEFIQNDHIQTTPKANKLAERVLSSRMKQAISTEFNAYPVPHIEEWDPLMLNMDGLHIPFQARTWSLPLDGTEMSMGTNRFVRLKKAKP